VKPVKSVSSYLGFEVRNDEDLAEALAAIRAKIHTVAEAFDAILRFADLPPEVAELGGRTCIAEELISRGRQCTLEGYVHQGRTTVYGIVDSIREGARGSSFARYQYPSTLPEAVQRRMIEATERFLAHVGYDGSPFNAEFYWEEEHDTVMLLEVNTRISKSHAPLFELVDGLSHHAVNLELALGREPRPPHREGPFPVAAKFFVREHEDGVVTRVPSEADLERLHQRVPEARVQIHVEEGMRLSELLHQDSYSYALAVIHLGAESEEALLRAYRTCLNELGLEVRRDEG
jgi:biotin carboxylase